MLKSEFVSRIEEDISEGSEVNIREAISQLESLQVHCKDFLDKEDMDNDIWRRDVEALEMAIKTLKRNRILDACCGSKMFWFQKEREDTVYMDNRQLEDTLCDGRKLIINPDIVADFREIPFKDNTFYLVVFDPPHLKHAGEKSWLAKKYGVLTDDWKEDLSKGFNECMRVLKPNGTLIFKWNEEQVKLGEVLKAIGQKPLFGNRRSKTHWLVFMKD